MKKLIFICAAVLGLAVCASAQPRQNDRPNASAGLSSVEAKYEGGIYGSTGRTKGTLKLDDANDRVVFYRKSDGREMFSIPYDAILVIYPDSKVSTSQTGNVVSRLPLPGAGLAGLISTRAQYLSMTFDDPDIDVKGTASFKFDDKKKLLNFISTLGERANMKQRGDAYYRPRSGSDF
jgi:hypothetical protein